MDSTEKVAKFSGDTKQDVEAQKSEGTLSLLGGTMLIVGSMIGIGIFLKGSTILAAAGSPGAALLVWVLGGFAAFCGGMTYAEWGLMIPESGGDMAYLNCAFPRPANLIPFMFAWGRCMIINPGICAALSIMAVSYFRDMVQGGLSIFAARCSAVGLMVGVWAILAFSNTIATRVSSIISIVKIATLVFFIGCGLFALSQGQFEKPRKENFGNAFKNTSSLEGIAAALVSVFFAYDGWSYLSSSIGELKNPQRNVSKAIISGISIAAGCYLMVNLAFFFALDVNTIKTSKLAFVFMTVIFKSAGVSQVVSGFIFVSAFGCAMAISFVSSRLVITAATRNLFPYSTFFANSHARFKTPFNAITLHTIISILFISVSYNEEAFDFLSDMCTKIMWIFYVMTSVGLLVLRYREPNRVRPFKTFLLCPIVVIVVGTFCTICSFIDNSPKKLSLITSLAGFGLLFFGLPVWFFHLHRPELLKSLWQSPKVKKVINLRK